MRFSTSSNSLGNHLQDRLMQFCLIIVAFAVGLTVAFPQVNDLRFSHLSTSEGLSHKNVHTILQDSKGFLWFGTKNGLSLYNGYSVQVIESNPKDKESLPSNDIRALAEDNEGFIWIGTYDSGIMRMDPQTKKGKIYNSFTTKELSSNTISAIHKDKHGNLWIATFGGGLIRIDSKTKAFTAFSSTTTNTTGLKSNNIITIHEDRKGDLWLGTFGGGLCKFDIQKQLFQTYLAEENTDIYAIEEDRKGNLWLGTYGKGLIRFDKETNQANYFSTKSAKGINSDFIRAIKEDALGMLWIGTEKGGGLTYFDPKTNQFYSYQHHPAKPNSLASNDINALVLDKLGVLWVATEGGGVDKFDTQNIAFRAYVSGEGQMPVFTSGAVTALYEDKGGILWIGGTFAEGLTFYAYDRNQCTYTRYDLPLEDDLLGFNYTITAITEDDLGNVWIGTAENGLYRYNKHTRGFRSFTSNNSALSSNGIETLYKDKRGILWVGTYEGGLCRLDPYHDNIQTFTHDPRKSSSLIGNTIKVIYEDSNGNLWLGTKQNGLSVFNPERNAFANYQVVRGGIRSLPGNSIRAITETNGQIWIGTDAGICRFDATSNSFVRINTRNGLPENDVCGLLADKKGNLWISSFSKGLSRFNTKTYQFRYFTVGEGLYSNEFQQWSAHKSYNGEFFFGGSKHFISFFPDQIIENHYTAPLYITSFSLFDKKKEFATPLYEMSVIELNYKDNFFEFEFTFLNYLDTDKNSYAYMMEGVDHDWKFVGDRRLASYTNLDPGEYTFRVKAADKYGQWNEKGRTIRIIIHPAWYQTWWARISAVVIVLGSILVYYRNRIRFFQKQKQILEGLVKERTAELVQKNAEIEAQKNSIEDKNIRLTEANELIEQINEELRAINNDLEFRVEQRTHQLRVANENLLKSNQELDMFIYRASHDIKGPLASLSGLCKVATMDVQDEKAQDYFTLLDKTCDKANHTLVRILKMYDIRNAEIQNEPLNVLRLIEDYGTDLNGRSVYQNVPFTVTSALDKVEIYSDKPLVDIIVSNLIENAFRYRKEKVDSYVKVYVESDNDNVHIRIHDNGIGIPENLRHKLFTMFFRGTVESSGTGLGLYLAKLAIERLGGTIVFRTDFPDETVFEIIFPTAPPISVEFPLPLTIEA